MLQRARIIPMNISLMLSPHHLLRACDELIWFQIFDSKSRQYVVPQFQPLLLSPLHIESSRSVAIGYTSFFHSRKDLQGQFG